jgi:hypothetical protein
MWRGFAEAMRLVHGRGERRTGDHHAAGHTGAAHDDGLALNEIGHHIDREPVPFLMAAPTLANGHI